MSQSPCTRDLSTIFLSKLNLLTKSKRLPPENSRSSKMYIWFLVFSTRTTKPPLKAISRSIWPLSPWTVYLELGELVSDAQILLNREGASRVAHAPNVPVIADDNEGQSCS